jgi:hypothetical protein
MATLLLTLKIFFPWTENFEFGLQRILATSSNVFVLGMNVEVGR